MTTAATAHGWPVAACLGGCGVCPPDVRARHQRPRSRPNRSAGGAGPLDMGTGGSPYRQGADVPGGFAKDLSPTPLALKSAPTPLKSTSRKA